MNANELADELVEWYEDYNGRFDLIEEAIAMLRQQQAEIEALKAKLKQYHLKEDLDRNLNLIYGKEFIK